MLLFLVVLIPALVLGVYSYTNAVKTALDNAQQTITRQMASAVQEIDNRLEEILIMRELLVTDTDVQGLQLGAKPDAQDVERMRNVYNLLTNIMLLNDSLAEVALYTGNEKVASSSGIYPAAYYFEDMMRYQGYTLLNWDHMQTERIAAIRYLPAVMLTQKTVDRYNSYQVIPMVTTFAISNGCGLVVFTMKTQSIKTVLETYMPYTQAEFAVYNGNGKVLLERQGSLKDSAVMTQTYVSAQNGWQYTSYVSRDEITLASRQMLTQVLLISICVIGLGFILVLITSRRVYHPLSSIQLMLSEAENASNDGGNSLEALEKQVTRLMEDSSSSKEQFDALAQSYAESLFFAQTMTEKKAQMLESIMTRGLGFHGGPYQCAAVRFCIEDAQNDVLAQQIFEKSFPVCTLRYSNVISLYIFEVGVSHERILIENAMQQLFRHMPDKIVGVAVGSEITYVRNMHTALNASLTVLQRISADSRGELLFSEDFDIASQYLFTYRDEWQLVEAMQRKESDTVHHMLDDILLKNYEKNVSHTQMQHLFDELRSTAIRYAQQENIILPQRNNDRPVSFDASRAELHQLYDCCLADVDARTRNVHALLARNADAYIQAHYQEDIYLETIATALGVSAKHLSRVYKQQNDMNISDQISLMRVEHAKQLLSTTDITINEIMSLTGFVSRATFLRSFKKHVGISPSAFRQIHNPAMQDVSEEEGDEE